MMNDYVDGPKNPSGFSESSFESSKKLNKVMSKQFQSFKNQFQKQFKFLEDDMVIKKVKGSPIDSLVKSDHSENITTEMSRDFEVGE